MFFQLFSIINDNLAKTMQSAYLCVIFHVKHKKITIRRTLEYHLRAHLVHNVLQRYIYRRFFNCEIICRRFFNHLERQAVFLMMQMCYNLYSGHIGRLKVHPWNYFRILYSFQLKLCRMVEVCIPKNPMVFVFRF